MNLYIRFLVSLRCKMVLKAELLNLGLQYYVIDFGEVEILESITTEQIEKLRVQLRKLGMEVLDDKRAALIEKIKNIIVEMTYISDVFSDDNYFGRLSENVWLDYTNISNIFSEVKGITIQQFIVLNKIEKVKELILYDELNLTEISNKLKYTNVAHLANQFKKITGLTPAYYKELRKKREENLENLWFM